MLRKKLSESLTARIFFITAVVLFFAVAVTFAFVAWTTPTAYFAVINEDLQKQTEALAERLKEIEFEKSGRIFDDFVRACQADILLLTSRGDIAETDSELMLKSSENKNITVFVDNAVDVGNNSVSTSWEFESSDKAESETAVATLRQKAIVADISFANQAETYYLYVIPRTEEKNLAVRALEQMAPQVLFVLLIISIFCAFIYSRYITKPIVRLSDIAEQMAALDFNWSCSEKRRDEIGSLGRSLNQMSKRLSAALEELESANSSLRGEVERERESERQRTAFFSAASHELKTPVTILKGQLCGMIEGVDVYRDRDKYLLRSLQVTERMENLIREMLSITRIEADVNIGQQVFLDLSELIKQQLGLDKDLLAQRRQRLKIQLTQNTFISGNASLLCKVIDCLFSNAVLYSPEKAEIRICCGVWKDCPTFTVENTDVHIKDSALPHLFEAFYREEGSRNRRSGGSGLGLYLVQTILARHRAVCKIENTADGVKATVIFPKSEQQRIAPN